MNLWLESRRFSSYSISKSKYFRGENYVKRKQFWIICNGFHCRRPSRSNRIFAISPPSNWRRNPPGHQGKAIELKDKGTETYEETKRRAELAYQDALKKADELAQVTKEKAQELSKGFKKNFEEVADAAEEAADSAAA